jgi:hypothetical protein
VTPARISQLTLQQDDPVGAIHNLSSRLNGAPPQQRNSEQEVFDAALSRDGRLGDTS